MSSKEKRPKAIPSFQINCIFKYLEENISEPGKFDKIEEENQTSFEGKIINEDNQANKDSITSSAKSTEEFILRNIKINESN